jgi:hypothetical protein
LFIWAPDENQRIGTSVQSLPGESIVMDYSNIPTGEPGVSDRAIGFGSPLLNLELSDLDLEAIAQGFQVDVESLSFWHSLGA